MNVLLTLLHGFFFTFFKLYKWYQIAQRTTYFLLQQTIYGEYKLQLFYHTAAIWEITLNINFIW